MSATSNTARQCNGEGCEGKVSFVIVGKTGDGERFRPASTGLEWSLRLAALLSTGERVQRVKHCLAPGHTSKGTPTLHVREPLKRCNPDVYWQVIQFAVANDLCM